MSSLRSRSLPTAAVTVMLLLTACGGGSGGGTGPDDDTRSATISTGDQQQAAASQAVATPPAIRLLNGANAPLAGVTVSWVVTAGGGSVTGASSETNAQGIATVGSWTLGTTGTQLLEARVTGLAAVVFHATVSTGPTQTEVVKTIGSSGGTLEITDAGNPLQGLSLTVPAGAFATSGTIRVSVADGASLPTLPSQFTLAGPALRVVTDLGFASGVMTLRVSRTASPGKKLVAIAYDPARHVSDVLPILSVTANSITVGSRHFRGSLLDPTPPAGSGLRGSDDGDAMVITLAEVVTALIGTQFDPAQYGWPVADNGSASFLTGHFAAIPSLMFWAAKSKVPITSLFAPMKVSGLYADTATFAAVTLAATRLNSFAADAQRTLEWLAMIPAAERDQNLYTMIQGKTTLDLHGLVLLALADRVTNPTRVGMILVYGVDPNVLHYFDPTEPGVAKELTLGPNGFAPVPFRRTVDEAPVMSAIVVPMTSVLFDIGQLGNVLVDMTNTLKADGSTRTSLDRLMAQLAGFPTVKLQLQATGGSSGWRDATDTLIVYDKNDRIRAVTTGDAVQKLVFVDPAGNQSATSDAPGTVPASVLTNYTGLANGATGQQRGAAVTPTGNRMLVPLNFTFGKGTFSFDGDNIPLTPHQQQTITARSNFRFPAGSIIDWAWGDGTSSEQHQTLGALTDIAVHTFQFSGEPPARFTVVARLMSSLFGQLIAADTIYVENTHAPFWIITSISDQDQLLDDDENGAGGDAFDRMARLIASPHSGLIGVTENGATSELFLRVKPSGIWTTFDPCCPPAFDPGESKEILGVSPTVQRPFGDFFAQFRAENWSQSTTDLTTGTMTGHYAPGSINYPISGGGTQNGPDYAVRITATRNGDTMTGVITLTNIFFGEDMQGLTPGDVSDFRFPFSAVRMR